MLVEEETGVFDCNLLVTKTAVGHPLPNLPSMIYFATLDGIPKVRLNREFIFRHPVGKSVIDANTTCSEQTEDRLIESSCQSQSSCELMKSFMPVAEAQVEVACGQGHIG